MRYFGIVLFAAIVAVIAGACATITKGTTQTVSVDTPGAAGAQCTLTSPSVGSMVVTSPAAVTVQKGAEAITVRCRKECFADGVGVISSNTEGMAAGNIIAGGIIGLGIDAASGAMNKYNEQNQIAMTPTPGCRAKA